MTLHARLTASSYPKNTTVEATAIKASVNAENNPLLPKIYKTYHEIDVQYIVVIKDNLK
jgi:hypothetical protein